MRKISVGDYVRGNIDPHVLVEVDKLGLQYRPEEFDGRVVSSPPKDFFQPGELCVGLRREQWSPCGPVRRRLLIWANWWRRLDDEEDL